MTQPVLAERLGQVAILKLNRPDQRNAMSADLVEALIDQILALGYDDSVGAIVLAGEGRGFCAGSDIAGLAAMDAAGRHRFEAESGRAARMIAQCPKPVIAAVHGFAIGGGLTLAAACDIVLSDPAARWSLPEVPIGLFPAWGIDAVIQRTGIPVARRLCWGIDTWTGQEAATASLVDMLSEDPQAEALALGERLAVLPRKQALAVKRYFDCMAATEEADHRAVGFFMAMTDSSEAEASFEKFGRR